MIPILKMTVPLVATVLVAACVGGGDDGGAETRTSVQKAEFSPDLPPDIGNMTPRVVLETGMGQIVLELDRERAPITVENFLYHVEAGFYNGLIFHRVRPDFMIQAGGFTPKARQRQTPRPDIENEADNGLKNVRGSLAMARTPEPHSASTQFFINLVDNSFLDYTAPTTQGWGYAVFGRVVEGMDVVDAIAQVKTEQRGPHEAWPVEPVIIERAYVEGG